MDFSSAITSGNATTAMAMTLQPEAISHILRSGDTVRAWAMNRFNIARAEVKHLPQNYGIIARFSHPKSITEIGSFILIIEQQMDSEDYEDSNRRDGVRNGSRSTA